MSSLLFRIPTRPGLQESPEKFCWFRPSWPVWKGFFHPGLSTLRLSHDKWLSSQWHIINRLKRWPWPFPQLAPALHVRSAFSLAYPHILQDGRGGPWNGWIKWWSFNLLGNISRPMRLGLSVLHMITRDLFHGVQDFIAPAIRPYFFEKNCHAEIDCFF